MDIEITDIEQRLAETLSGGARLVFWQDEAGTYREILSDLKVPDAVIVDATNAELVTKRRVLREEPHVNYVVYRAGEVPAPTEDLIYDITLRAKRFSCSEEGIWANECGVPAELVDVIAEHRTFFRSKERRDALASSELPKSSPDDLRIAMVAATLGVREGTRRDVARAVATRLVVELSRGKEPSLSAISEAGLADAMWRLLRDEIGYRVPDGAAPTSRDLAFRLLEGTLGDLANDKLKIPSAEALKIVSGIAGNTKTETTYEWLMSSFGAEAFSLVPDESRACDLLASVEHVPQADEWMLSHLASDAAAGGLDARTVEELAVRRATAPCAKRYAHHYGALLALVRFRGALAAYWTGSPSATSMKAIMDGYASSWFEVDRRYRDLRSNYAHISQLRFGQAMADPVEAAEADYDKYLSDSAAKFQGRVLEGGSPWPPKAVPAQAAFFSERVFTLAPEASDGHRVGVIVSDALRYECGAELAERLTASRSKGIAGRTRVSIEARAGAIPSYTQLGMAALLPDGPMEIDPKTALVLKGSKSTAGTKARQALLAEKSPGSIAVQAEDIPQNLADAASNAPIIWVYHNAIDRVGDKQATERKTFKAVDEAFDEIEALVARLLAAGCGTVLITSDHGFIYQDKELESKDFADIDGLNIVTLAEGVDSERTRRFVVSTMLPDNALLIKYLSSDLGLGGSYTIGVPRGAMRLRLSGSGARFVHGGASPQECIVPVVTVETTGRKAASRPSDVEGFPVGRTVITGPSVVLDVYQKEPVGEAVGPAQVKVGVYAKDGKLLSPSEVSLELSSASPNAEDRKVRVRLDLTDDVDQVGIATVRISKRVGTSNAYTAAWERDYQVNRAFGMDF